MIGIFSLPGESISPHLLRCYPFEVDNHIFMGHCLIATALDQTCHSMREWSRLNTV
jgi:hypothetical protein